MWRRDTASVALLLSVLPAWSCASPQEFRAVLIDAASKKPVPSARVVLALKKEGARECTIDTSLTGLSNTNGEVRLRRAKPGDYVVFYNLSGVLRPELNGKVVRYDRVGNDAYTIAISNSLGPLLVLKGSVLGIADGLIGVNKGHMYAVASDLAMIASEGKLLTVRIPGAGGAPPTIEINTGFPPPSP